MPWQSALNNLDYFYLMFTQTDVYELLQVCSNTSYCISIWNLRNVLFNSWLYVYWFQSNSNEFCIFCCRTTPESTWPPFLNILRLLLKIGHMYPLAIQTSKWSINTFVIINDMSKFCSNEMILFIEVFIFPCVGTIKLMPLDLPAALV